MVALRTKVVLGDAGGVLLGEGCGATDPRVLPYPKIRKSEAIAKNDPPAATETTTNTPNTVPLVVPEEPTNVASKSDCYRGHHQRPKESIIFSGIPKEGGENAQVIGLQYVAGPIELKYRYICRFECGFLAVAPPLLLRTNKQTSGCGQLVKKERKV